MPLAISTGPVAVPVYLSPLISVCDGRFYIGYPYGVVTQAANQVAAPLRDNVLVSMCFINRTIFAVDGMNITTLPLVTLTVTPFAATAGTAPTNCFLCCNWRGRFVLAGDSDNPQNFYMSRQGTPTDFNYAALDPAAAVAGNLSRSGQIGEPIIALLPYSDDVMLVGCTNSLWMIQGDPADGGTIIPVSEQLGIVGPNAWTVDPNGILYFIARGGLYRFKPSVEQAGAPELITGDTYDQYFRELVDADSTLYVSMQWDVDAKMMHIFATPTVLNVPGVHLIMDARNGGLWPQQYPVDMGPTATARYSANNIGGKRAILLGGVDGVIREFTSDNLSDDGSAIAAYITLGPVKPQPEAAILSALTIDFGEVTPADNDAAPVPGLATGVDVGSGYVWTFDHDAGTLIDGSIMVSSDNTNIDFFNTVTISPTQFMLIFENPLTDTPVATFSLFGDPPTPWNAKATINAGPDAYSVTDGTPHSTASIFCQLDRRQKTFRQRFRAGWFSVTIANDQLDTYFSFESALLEFIAAGRNRERR